MVTPLKSVQQTFFNQYLYLHYYKLIGYWKIKFIQLNTLRTICKLKLLISESLIPI